MWERDSSPDVPCPCSLHTCSAIDTHLVASSSFPSSSSLLKIFLFSFERRQETERREEKEGEEGKKRERERNGNLNIWCIYKRNVKWVNDRHFEIIKLSRKIERTKRDIYIYILFSLIVVIRMSMTTTTATNPSIDSMRKIYDHVWHWIVKQTYESKSKHLSLFNLRRKNSFLLLQFGILFIRWCNISSRELIACA